MNSKVEFGTITQDNVEQLRKVNQACFPVSYQDKYYKDVVAQAQGSSGNGDCGHSSLSKLAYVGGFVVGAVSSRIEDISVDTEVDVDTTEDDNDNNNNDNNNDKKQKQQKQNTKTNKIGQQRIYIMTLGVFAAYRGRGIGTQLIQSIINYADECNNKVDNNDNDNDDHNSVKKIVEIALHVHIDNKDAITFYTTKFGFVIDEKVVENYYNKRQVNPPHAIRLYKPI